MTDGAARSETFPLVSQRTGQTVPGQSQAVVMVRTCSVCCNLQGAMTEKLWTAGSLFMTFGGCGCVVNIADNVRGQVQ